MREELAKLSLRPSRLCTALRRFHAAPPLGHAHADLRRAITVNGTPASPITIRAADGERPIVTRPQPANFSCDQNNIEIVNSSYLVIRSLHFKGGAGGVSFIGGHHITFEDNEVYETGNNAIRLNSGNTDALVIRRNHIHHTGLLASSVGTTEGEGMYVGCNNATCMASNHLIESNYIHHTRATSGGGNDGIEITQYRASSSTEGAPGSTSSRATRCGTAARPSRWSPMLSCATI